LFDNSLMSKESSVEIRPVADLHCHILPDWDDGPRALNESLELAAKAASSGLKQILVTPHVGRRLRNIVEKPSDKIAEGIGLLQEEITRAGIPIELVQGAELTMDSEDLPTRLQKEPWLTIGGQGYYALIESSYNRWPQYGDLFMHHVAMVGITPIIAHPERYPDVQKDISVIRDVVQKGALVQLTARSLSHSEDRKTRQCSIQLLKAGMVAIVASDAHGPDTVFPGDVVDIVRSTVGEKAARRILVENPQKILTGKPVYNIEPPQPQKNGLAGLVGRLMKR
jgi:protein-tyrosine phosphatase